MGGTISGLTAGGLVLTTSTGDTLTVATDATDFTMPTRLTAGSTYAVSIQTQPTAELCQVVNGSGTVAGDVGSVQIQCSSNTVSFTSPGDTSWQVPAGVYLVRISATGGGGGSGTEGGCWASRGGNAAKVETTLSVTPGDTLVLGVGGGGAGGTGGASHSGGGGGGTTVNAGTPNQIIAGGGGGGGMSDCAWGGNGGGGGAGGLPNAANVDGSYFEGGIAYGGAGGVGGTGATPDGGSGGSGNGGAGGAGSGAGGVGNGAGTGGTGSTYGGGGGGGYGGGGGGTNGSGGAGGGSIGPAGSSYSNGGGGGDTHGNSSNGIPGADGSIVIMTPR